MIVAVRKGNYSDDLQTYDPDKVVLQTNGCDCCSSEIEPNKANIDKAIAEHEDMIAQLKALL